MTAPDYADLRRLLAEWDFGHSRVRPKVWDGSKWRYQCQCGETFLRFAEFEAHRHLVGAEEVAAAFADERDALIRERDEAVALSRSWQDQYGHMKRERDEAREERDDAICVAEGMDHFADVAERLRWRNNELVVERDEARAKVEAVEALRVEWDAEALTAWREADRLRCGEAIADQISRRAERLRAALADGADQ